jgi:two-component system, LuxR family, response regulator FixJ
MTADQTIFVIDDEEAVRDSIHMMLERRGYRVQIFESAEAFLAAAPSAASGCIVCDIRLKGISGLDLHRRLLEAKSGLPVILITGHGDIEMAVRALRAGAFDFIEKPFDDTRLYTSIAQALSASRELLAKEEQLAGWASRVAELTDRQRQVMELLVDGLSNKDIGKRLGISPRTVETYRALVMAKTNASSLAELVKISMKLGMA